MSYHRKRKTEIRCSHTYERDLINIKGYDMEYYLCKKCYSNTINLLNKKLRERFEDHPTIDIKQVGIYCDRCDRRTVRSHYLTYKIEPKTYRRYIDTGKKDMFGQPIKEPVETFDYGEVKTKKIWQLCDRCHKEINRITGIMVTTTKSIYIPTNVPDEMVENLYGNRLTKTNKEYTLVPTEALKKLVELTTEKKLELTKQEK